jgi:multiple sugar transport system substrate-binding protein
MAKTLSRRKFLQLSVLGSAAVVAASCAPAPAAVPAAPKATEKPAEVATVAKAPTEAPKAAGQKVKIRYQSRSGSGTGVSETLWKPFFQYFYDKNPNIEVEWLAVPAGDLMEQVQAQMVAGDGPDVYQLCCWQSTYFIQKGQALNLQSFIDRDSAEVNIKDFYAQEFNPWKLKGDIYFMPYYTGTVAIYYNKDMFAKEGVEPLPTKWGELTFEKYRAIAKKFVKRDKPLRFGTTNYGLTAGGNAWLTQYWLRGFGTHMVDPQDSDNSLLCSKEALDCLTAIKEMTCDEHSFAQGQEVSGTGIEQQFNGEMVAMVEVGSWNLWPTVLGSWSAKDNVADKFLTFAWDVAPMWKGPGGITTHQSVDGQGCWSKSKYPEAAWQLSKEVASAHFEELNFGPGGEGLQPSRKSVMPKWAAALRKKWPILEKVNLEVFVDAMTQDLGGPEEMFNNDQVCKTQILQPAFDQVMIECKAGPQLICEYSKVIPRFNKGEITIDQIGAELAKIKA